MPTTTRATPASISASVHGPVRPAWLHGSERGVDGCADRDLGRRRERLDLRMVRRRAAGSRPCDGAVGCDETDTDPRIGRRTMPGPAGRDDRPPHATRLGSRSVSTRGPRACRRRASALGCGSALSTRSRTAWGSTSMHRVDGLDAALRRARRVDDQRRVERAGDRSTQPTERAHEPHRLGETRCLTIDHGSGALGSPIPRTEPCAAGGDDQTVETIGQFAERVAPPGVRRPRSPCARRPSTRRQPCAPRGWHPTRPRGSRGPRRRRP